MEFSINNFDINKIAFSGQCFRMKQIDINTYENIVFNKRFIIKQIDKNNIYINCTEKEFNKFFIKYFDLNFDYNSLTKQIDKNDLFLKNCFKFGKGIRILKQEPFECLISFIISQRKSIPAIKTSINRLCEFCGTKHVEGSSYYYTFPTPKQIYDNRNLLYKCGLGYRDKYIINTVTYLLENELNLNSLNDHSNEDLKNILLSFYGVGDKIANCVLLFSYGRYNICPIDVWIKRVINYKYNGCLPTKYQKYIGIFQQYWYYYIINNKSILS